MATITEIKEIIAAADICGHVPLIKGVHGIGKSEAAAQYAKENNMHYEPLILSLMDTGDMLGLPVTQSVGGVQSTVWAAPSWYTNIVNAAWPTTLETDELQFIDLDFEEHFFKQGKIAATVTRENLNQAYCDYYKLPDDVLQILRQNNVYYHKGKRSVLNLDEFNRAPSDILNASLQLILDHRLHNHILPTVAGQETLIVAAINPTGDDYTVQEFDPALLDRFISCEASAELKTWLPWARENKVNQLVVDFLIENQDKFHYVPKDGSKGASPRSWTRLARYIDRIDSTNKDIMSHYVIGTVGSALAARFMAFYNSYSTALNFKDLDKLLKREIRKAAKKGEINPAEVAEGFVELVEGMDAIRRGEYVASFVEEYIEKEEAIDALPLMVFMYALPMESLSAAFKTMQTNNVDHYTQLAIFDKELNNKELFRKLVANFKE